MENIGDKIKEVINGIDKTTDLFYQNKINDGYIQLENMLFTINETVNAISNYKKNIDNNCCFDENKLNTILTEAMNALEVRDSLLLADILQYDLKEMFVEVNTKINN